MLTEKEKAGRSAAHHKRPQRRARGTAEIELLLAVLIFITLLMLVVGSLKLGLARETTEQSADARAFQDATETTTPQYAQDQPLPAAAVDAWIGPPALPNRLHIGSISQTVTVTSGDRILPSVTIKHTAEVAAPAWTMSAYPATGDATLTAQWFSNDADTVRGPITSPLGLSASWPP